LMNLGAFGALSAFGLVGDKTEIRNFRGLGWKRPSVGIALTICFLSLAGIPPTAGFFAKYLLFKELIVQGHVGLAILGVLASLVSVGYYLKPIVAMYMEPMPNEIQEQRAYNAPMAGATILVSGFLIILLGLVPNSVLRGFAQPSVKKGLAYSAEVVPHP